jgi:AcrR family transcriptional regulator
MRNAARLLPRQHPALTGGSRLVGFPERTFDLEASGVTTQTKVPVQEQTRARILAIAAEQFASEGYAATSIRDIARSVGVTVGAIYGHFPSKGRLLVAVYEEGAERIGRAVDVAGAGRSTNVPSDGPNDGPNDGPSEGPSDGSAVRRGAPMPPRSHATLSPP